MDRLRDRSGDGGGRHSRMPSRWPDGPPLGDHPPRHFSHSAGPKNADGFSGGRHHPYRAGNQDHPPGGGRSPVGFRSGPGGFGPIPDEQPMPGGPRRGGGGGFTRGGSPNASEGSTFAKLFVGAVPRTATQEDIRPIFEEHGHVLEVALIKDKRTGEQQSCCFIKYATSEDADRAIRALHNQLTLPGGAGPIQVRYADGERERLGAVEDKLFVGSLNRRATEKEVEEIFSPYGRVDDVYLMRDEMKQSRGCGFVKFHKREMAQAAINALSGVFTMRGCEQPLIVRFADPKRPRPGESRGGPTFGGPGFGSRSRFPGFRDPIDGRPPPNAWNSANPESLVPSSQASPHGFSGHLHSVGGFSAVNSTGFSSDSISQPIAPQISLMQKPNLSSQDVPPSLQLPQMQSNSAPTQSFLGPTPHLAQLQTAKDQQVSAPYLHMQNIQSPAHQLSQQPIHHSAGFPSFPQTLPPHQFISLTAQLPASQPTAATFQIPMNLQQGLPSVNVVDQQPWPGSMVQIPVQQSPAQLLPQQQTPVLQSTFQSQQPFSQLQQLQLLQPPTLGQQQNPQQILNTLKQQQISTTSAGHAVLLASATSPSSSLQLGAQTNAVKCSWTEHTSPEGFKYYYNNATKESKWEKPEEFALFEQQQKLQQPQQQSIVTQQPLVQSQMQTNVQVQPMQIPQLQPQILLKHPTQLQQFQHSVVDVSNPPQLQAPGSSIDAGWLQMGPMVSQDWMWKNRPAG